jgi:1-deoxy-D-xylulose-5-phosphate reductoisomerase
MRIGPSVFHGSDEFVAPSVSLSMSDYDALHAHDAPLRVAILGSSGSIGTRALDVARANQDKINVVALAVNTSVTVAVAQALEFKVKYLAIADESKKNDPALAELPDSVKVAFGSEAVEELVYARDVECVLNALVGAAGLRISYACVKAGKRLALANKESLVVGGDLIMPLATPGTLLPVDSEHSAIFQCFIGEYPSEATKIHLTASGGPFRNMTRQELEQVTVEQALAHPTWNMGKKITIDSATLMNKGLEAIEAHHLFGFGYDEINIVVHPQSCVHSMVEYRDGSVKAHLGVADMAIPIMFAFSYPHRFASISKPINFFEIAHLDFMKPDYVTFPCLSLALAAGETGGTLPCVMNAANEVAVAKFLEGSIRFYDISDTVEHCMEKHSVEKVESIEQLEDIDAETRILARYFIEGRA